MSFFDKVIEAANTLGGKKEGEQAALTDGLVGLLKNEGVSGIVNTFKTKGLGEIASSWIGSGPNAVVSTDQIKQVIGNDRLVQLAQKAGVSEENAAKFLREVLPGVIDKLTPQGQIPVDDPGAGQTPGAPPSA